MAPAGVYQRGGGQHLGCVQWPRARGMCFSLCAFVCGGAPKPSSCASLVAWRSPGRLRAWDRDQQPSTGAGLAIGGRGLYPRLHGCGRAVPRASQPRCIRHGTVGPPARSSANSYDLSVADRATTPPFSPHCPRCPRCPLAAHPAIVRRPCQRRQPLPGPYNKPAAARVVRYHPPYPRTTAPSRPIPNTPTSALGNPRRSHATAHRPPLLAGDRGPVPAPDPSSYSLLNRAATPALCR